MKLTQKQIQVIFIVGILCCFLPVASPAIALAIGILLSLLGIRHGNISKYSSFCLQASVVLMGFGMNLPKVLSSAKSGFVETAISVTCVMILGLALGKLFKVDSKVGLLISSGTAICGGSAIAAISPLINSKNVQISFSLAVVFILNAVALFLFPYVGHELGLSQEIFGNWAAIAIHDTSSVVGAGASYGDTALQIATTVKLIRALWIIPLSIVVILFTKGEDKGKLKFPWFILLFILATIFAYLVPVLNDIYVYSHVSVYHGLKFLGNKGMVVALFLIGSNISIKSAKEAGIKSFALGITLWVIVAVSSLLLLTHGHL